MWKIKKYNLSKENIQENIQTHLNILIEEYRYFTQYTQEAKVDQKLIHNSFNTDASEVTEAIQEDLIDLQNDRNCKDAFESNSLESFWCQKAISYKLREIALR